MHYMLCSYLVVILANRPSSPVIIFRRCSFSSRSFRNHTSITLPGVSLPDRFLVQKNHYLNWLILILFCTRSYQYKHYQANYWSVESSASWSGYYIGHMHFTVKTLINGDLLLFEHDANYATTIAEQKLIRTTTVEKCLKLSKNSSAKQFRLDDLVIARKTAEH